ncbi:hypothetical protein H180DRAFT_00631 [Streptomyces sp. WMMB 322]|nr:hypothetical protein H180DRAFT_00631 [Streptomyces sp. WMMB 322]
MRHTVRSRISSNRPAVPRHSLVCSLFGAVSLTAVGVGAAFAAPHNGSVIAHRTIGASPSAKYSPALVNSGTASEYGMAAARNSGGNDVHDWG